MLTGCPRRPCAYTRSSQLPKCPLRMSTPVGRSQAMRLAQPRLVLELDHVAERGVAHSREMCQLRCHAPQVQHRRAQDARALGQRLVRKRDGRGSSCRRVGAGTRPAMPPRRPPHRRGPRTRAAARRDRPTIARSTRYSRRSRTGDGARRRGFLRRRAPVGGDAPGGGVLPGYHRHCGRLKEGQTRLQPRNAACHRRCESFRLPSGDSLCYPPPRSLVC